MKRLIVEYLLLADCGGDSYTISEPAIYESKEAFLRDFAIKLHEDASIVKLGGTTFYARHFKDGARLMMPTVYTVDEWFSNCEAA